jgi:hypothetical protein
MSKKYLSSLFASCFLAVLLTSVGIAQDVTGNIVGTVRDSNGGGVPNATVSVTDPSKNNLVVRTITTSDDGGYSVPNLQSGLYTVTVEAPGFKKSINNEVKVDVGQRRELTVTLVAGRIEESVEVTAGQVAVELSTPTSGTTINGDQIRELSVNNRNFVQLVTLAPGVSANLSDQVYVGTTNPTGQANTVPISVNGARSSSNTWTVDGADITDRGSNLTIQAYPSIDSIGEFKVLRSLYPAESGRSGGGQINVITRSGTDSFHGSAYEFFRNEKLNANDFITNRNTGVPPFGRNCEPNRFANTPECRAQKARRAPFRYNDYGFTIGGPVYFLNFGELDPGKPGMFGRLPRTYFFFSEEQRKDRRYPSLTSVVPNAQLRNGVFSFPICLAGTISTTTPVTRTCTQVLPAGTSFSSVATVNPVSAAYLNGIYKNVKLPTQAPFTLVDPGSGRADFQQEILKVDTSLTNKLAGYYRYQRDKIPTADVNSLFSSGSSIPGVSTSATDSPGRAHTLQATYTASSNLIFEGRFNYSYGAILSRTTGLIARSVTPIPTNFPYAITDDRNPILTIAGFNALSANGAYDNFSNKFNYGSSATYLAGDHTLKFGFDYSRYRKNENLLGGTNQGSFSGFNNTIASSPSQGIVCLDPTNQPIVCPTGQQSQEQSFANFLLGTNASFTQSKYDLTADFRQQNFEGYAQDEYRMRRDLTVYLGVRYSFFGAPYDKNGFLTNFDPAAYKASSAPAVTGAGNRVGGNWCNGIIVNSQNYQTGPAAYNCTPTASPYGKYVFKSPTRNFAPRIGIAWDPFGKGTTAIRTGYGIFHEQTLVGNLELHLGANPPYQETITVSGVNIANPTPGATSVVVSASPPSIIRGVDTDYKTPYMQHWSLDFQHQFGSNTIVSVGYYGSKGTHLIGIQDINNLPAGYAATQTCAVGAATAPTAPCQAKDAATGLYVPFTSAAGELILDQLRPYKGWRGIAMVSPRYNSNYHSLQVAGQKRFGGVSQLNVAYTWSKNLTDNQTDRSSAPMDAFNIQNDYGRAQLDRRHIFVTNFVYELPFFTKSGAFLRTLFGGWQASSIITLQTGIPFTPTYAGYDPAGIGFLNASSPAGGRPYVTCNPNEGGKHTFEEYFNYTCFQSTTPTLATATPGTASRGSIDGPPTKRVDFTMTKNFHFGETMNLQLRGEAFNVFNHTNFTTLNVAASTPHAVNATTGAVTGFGVVSGVRDPRTLQLGIKFSF